MIQQIKNRLQREDKGFTLIELMVVVLIIAILIAIAIPTFLGARGRAQDRAAQSSLRNTVTAAKAIYTDDEDYADATTVALTASEPSLAFVGAAVDSDDSNEISDDAWYHSVDEVRGCRVEQQQEVLVHPGQRGSGHQPGHEVRR